MPARHRPAQRELDAAGITGAGLRSAYLRCRALHGSHGRTYFLATRLLRPAQRPAVHALYGFARWADEIVDAPGDDRSAAVRRNQLDALEATLDSAFRGTSPNPSAAAPLVMAVVDTSRRLGLEQRLFTAFLASMRMDTYRRAYPDYDSLYRYMYGSAGVIGLQMLPVLGIAGAQQEAAPAAEAMGVAFQLTNFLRDIGEDLDRGRVYLPADELGAFGVTRDLLVWCRRQNRTDARVRRALAHLVARTRAVYRRATPGIGLLMPASRPCVRTAHRLYAGILDQIERSDYDVLHRRVVVPAGERLAIAAPALGLAYAARTRDLVTGPSPGRGA